MALLTGAQGARASASDPQGAALFHSIHRSVGDVTAPDPNPAEPSSQLSVLPTGETFYILLASDTACRALTL
jgi:hypothetical protein